MSVEHLTIHHLLGAQAARTPDAIAIAAPGRTLLTYRQLLIQVDNVVKMLDLMGLGRGDRIAMVLPNGPEMAVAFLGVAAGATCAPLNPAYRDNEFAFYLSDLKAKALIVQSETDSPAISVAQRNRIPIIQLTRAARKEAGIFTLTGDGCSNPECGGSAKSDDVALALHTSGTTSRPKLVALTQANICTSAYNSVAALELSSSDRCLNVMPLFHIHGLMVILSSLAAGASVLCTPEPDLSDFFRCMEEFHPSWYTASPTMHHTILAQAKQNRNIIARRPLRFIRSSSSPLPPKIMAELESVFSAPVIESYAMTEASYQISSNPLPPGKRKIGSVGVVMGLEVAIMDDLGNLLPRTDTGEIVIRGSNVTRGYENNPAANAASFSNGWFKTGDVGHLDADGYLFIEGRLKEIINRGGEKISPHEVDEVIMQHPSVAQVATFAVPHPVLGEDVAATIVLREDISATENEIREFAFDRLAYFKVPRQVIIVDEIPKGPTGKVQRVGLAEKLGLSQIRPPSIGVDGVPRTPVEIMLAEIWTQVLNLDQVGIYDNFFDLGGHSLLALQLFAKIEKTFGKNLRLRALLQAPTIEQLAKLLFQKEPPSPWSSLVTLQPDGSKRPFFWVHGDYSNAFLHRYLGPDQPLYGLMHQSEDGKLALYTKVETIAAHYLEEIRTVQLVGPYFLGGYSFGGTVAFEMAQQLKREGEKVAFLVLLDSQFPSDDRPSSSDVSTEIILFRDKVHRSLHNLALLGPQDKLAYVLVRVKGTIKDKIKERTERINKILKKAVCKICLVMDRPIPFSLRSAYILDIYYQARRNYVPQLYPGRAIYFKSEKRSSDHRLNWDRLIAGGLEVYEVPGDHMEIIKKENAEVWAKRLKSCLSAAQAKI
jgi:oxalate---CoA ligase